MRDIRISRLEVSRLKNYHTHTFRCKHAEGDAIDYAQGALRKGITVLGMTDHTALPDDRWLGMRMAYSELSSYAEAIERAQTYYPELTILKGMECEWSQDYQQFFVDVLLGEYNFDYLILGCHFFPYQGSFLSSHSGLYNEKRLVAYTDYLIKSMESKLFAFVAHPDLFGLSYLTWDANTEAAARDILSAAQELQIPLEINGYGLMRKIIETPEGSRSAYPWLNFWEIARDYAVTVVVNSDAHHPRDLDLGLREGLEIVETLGLQLADLEHLQRR